MLYIWKITCRRLLRATRSENGLEFYFLIAAKSSMDEVHVAAFVHEHVHSPAWWQENTIVNVTCLGELWRVEKSDEEEEEEKRVAAQQNVNILDSVLTALEPLMTAWKTRRTYDTFCEAGSTHNQLRKVEEAFDALVLLDAAKRPLILPR